MWAIYEKSTCEKALKKAPKDVLKRYEAWKRIVELSGPMGLRQIKGFHDEALKGKWKGCRSSRLDIKWRVIYEVKNKCLEIYVFEVNPHEY